MNWFIVLVVLIVLLIVSLLLGYFTQESYYGWEDIYFNITIILSILVLIIGVLCIALPLEIKQQKIEYESYQELVEITYSEENSELNYAMNVKVIELNQWLANAKSKEEAYGKWSFYYGKLDDLEYIEIGD